MTATGVRFDGSDLAAAIVAIDSLSIDANDLVVQWQLGNKVFVVRVPVA